MRGSSLVRVGAIWVTLLIGVWLLLSHYALGAANNTIPLPQGAVARLGLGTVHAVVYSPDGRMLASGSYDGTVLFWEMEGIISFEQVTFVKEVPLWAFEYRDGAV